MGTIVESFAKTLELLTGIVVSGAEGTYKKVRPLAPVYLKSLATTALVLLTLVPALALAKMVTGEVEFAYAAAFIAIIFTLVLGLLWSPLGIIIGMLTGSTPNPVTGGERYVKFVATILFAELMISGYIIRVPTHQNLEAVPLLIMAATAVGLGTFIWGGWLSGRFYTFVAAVIMTLTTLSFFMPQTFATASRKFGGLDAWIYNHIQDDYYITTFGPDERVHKLKVNSRREIIRVPVGGNGWSEKVFIPAGYYTGHVYPGSWYDYKRWLDHDLPNPSEVVIIRTDSNRRGSEVSENGSVVGQTATLYTIISRDEHMQFRSDQKGYVAIMPFTWIKY